jgi:hypothetical protein
MKTTIDIADQLLEAAKATARREGMTVRALVEEGLRGVLARYRPRRTRFQLRDASFTGEGVQPGVELGNWQRITSMIYEERGG